MPPLLNLFGKLLILRFRSAGGLRFFILHQNERGDERRQGDRQNDADAAGDAADDLRGHIGGADELPGIQPQRIQIDDEGQAAAQKCLMSVL